MHSLCYKYLVFRLHQAGLAKYKEFGPVVREEVLPGVNVVWLFHPQVRITVRYSDLLRVSGYQDNVCQ